MRVSTAWIRGYVCVVYVQPRLSVHVVEPRTSWCDVQSVSIDSCGQVASAAMSLSYDRWGALEVSDEDHAAVSPPSRPPSFSRVVGSPGAFCPGLRAQAGLLNHILTLTLPDLHRRRCQCILAEGALTGGPSWSLTWISQTSRSVRRIARRCSCCRQHCDTVPCFLNAVLLAGHIVSRAARPRMCMGTRCLHA
jgi:hypothetical protein